MPDEPVARLKPRLVYARGGGWSGAVTQARGEMARPAAMWCAGTRFSSGTRAAGSATAVAQLIIELPVRRGAGRHRAIAAEGGGAGRVALPLPDGTDSLDGGPSPSSTTSWSDQPARSARVAGLPIYGPEAQLEHERPRNRGRNPADRNSVGA
jgi:hypothetical protein